MTNEIRNTVRLYRRIRETTSPEQNRDLWIARSTLLEKNSYRLPRSARSDYLIGFRVLWRTSKRWFGGSGAIIEGEAASAAVVGGTVANADVILRYVAASSGKSSLSFVPRDAIGFQPMAGKLSLLHFLLFAFPIACAAIFNKRRDNLALVISSVAEISFVKAYLNFRGLKYVFDFYSFESDSNFMCLALRDQSVRICKIPSSGPLASHYLKTLTDDLVISTPYQEEEIVALGQDILFSNILRWPPERAHTYYEKFCLTKPSIPEKVLGFYSHGQWARNLAGHAGYGAGVEEDEIRILTLIKNYCMNRPDVHVIVYPHPKELDEKIIARTIEFYDKTLGTDRYELMRLKGGSAQHFDKVNVAIASYSTIIYERLYCGMKILISGRSKLGFPIENSKLHNICFSEQEDFDNKLDVSLNQTTADFFHHNDLEAYLWNNFPSPLI